MSIFTNNPASSSKSIFNNNQTGQQQAGQTGGNKTNIFTNNANQNTNQMPTNNPKPHVNLFTQQPVQQQQTQQQSIQQPAQGILNPPKPKPQQQIPLNPLIVDSLCEKHSFVQIYTKVKCHNRLTLDQINFVKHGGIVIFKKDLWKSNYFKTIKSKQPHLGFTKSQIIYQGDIPRSVHVEEIFYRLIRHFASICDTNEMNGYFLIKPLIRSSKIFTKLYQPKAGLDNKVFEVNNNYLNTFYLTSFLPPVPQIIQQNQQSQQKRKINDQNKDYLEFLNNLISKFNQEWHAYLGIVEIVCCGYIEEQNEKQDELKEQNSQRSKSANNSQGQQLLQKSTGQQQQQLQPQPKTRYLRFNDFLESNILSSLFQSFKEFSLSQYSKQEKNPLGETTSNERKRYFQIKKQLFFRISGLISRILSSRITQQMLMEKEYLPLAEVAQFIDYDIQVVHLNSLIEPIHEETYNSNGMNIILGLIPFSAFINTKGSQLLKNYFKLDSTKQKFNRTLSKQYKMSILKTLQGLKAAIFMTIKLWAMTQIEAINFQEKHNGVSWKKRMQQGRRQSSGNDIQSQGKQSQIELWQQYLQVNAKTLNILQQKRWSYLLCTMILTLGIKPMLQRQFLRSILSYYTKKLVKNNAYRFFVLWKELILLEKTMVSYRQLERIINHNPDIKQGMIKLSKMVINQFDLYVAGMMLRQMLQDDLANESFRIFCNLLRDENDGIGTHYSKELFRFVDAINDDGYLTEEQKRELQEIKKSSLPQSQKLEQNSSIRLKMLINQLARHFKLPYASGTLISSAVETTFQQISDEEMYHMADYEQQIKFICKLVQVNFLSLQEIEDKMFGSIMREGQNQNNVNVNHINKRAYGLKICIFLCMLLGKMNIRNMSNIKCIRYIIQTIDILYSSQQTQSIMIFALSIVFPADKSSSILNYNRKSGGKNSPGVQNPYKNYSNITNKVVQTVFQYPLDKILGLLLQENVSQGEQRHQIQKLRRAISHHVNHLIQYSDSLDLTFPIKKNSYTYYNAQNPNLHVSTKIIYERIQKQLKQWQFFQACQFVDSGQLTFRPADWLYTWIKVLRLPQLLPVDIETIILSMTKMRIPTQQSSSYDPMVQIFHIINQANILQQLLQTLKPSITVQHERIKVVNELLTNYQPSIYYKQIISGGHLYHKYENAKIIDRKNKFKVLDEQCLMLKKICMFVRLIQEVLKLKLQPEYDSYTLLTKLQIVDQIHNILTNPQHIHTYNIEYMHKSQPIKQTINLQSVIVSLLRLYGFQVIFPTQLVSQTLIIRQKQPFFMLNYIEGLIINSFSFQRTYKVFTNLDIVGTSTEVLKYYENELGTINEKFFYSIPYVPNDFGIDSFETSLKTCVFSILQLLCQLKSGQLVAKCVQNFSYPIKSQNLLIKFNPTLRYLKHDRSRSQVPLLFEHIKATLSYRNELRQYKYLQVKARTIEALCVMMGQDLFYNEILKILGDIRLDFVNLLTDISIVRSVNFCPQSTQINIYNKIALFSYQLVKTTIVRHPHQLDEIINNYLIRPSNLLKMLYQCMYSIRDRNINLEDLLLVKSYQSMPNYLMQQRLTYLSLYRATLDILFRIALDTVQLVDKQDLYEITGYLLDFGFTVTDKPISLMSENNLINKLNLTPLEVILIRNQPQENIKTTILSEEITEYKYCYRTNVRKYGNNFMYPTYSAFHRIKILYKSLEENLSELNHYTAQTQQLLQLSQKQYIRKKLYYIQLINCLKSIQFSNDSMVKSYFQLMNLLTNIGSVGQNVSRFQIDITVPKLHQTKAMANKYCLENKFSFYQALNQVRKKLFGINLAQKVDNIVQKMLTYVKINTIDNNQQLLSPDQQRQQRQNHLRKTSNIQSQTLVKQLIPCINPDHVVIFIINLLSTAVNCYFYENTIKYSQSAQKLKAAMKSLLRDLKSKNIKCTLRVLLIAYDKILEMDEKLIKFEIERFRGGHIRSTINQLDRKQQQQDRYSDVRIKKVLIVTQQEILQELRRIFYQYLQTQKPTLILNQNRLFSNESLLSGKSMMVNTKSSKKKDIFGYSKAQVIENVALICGLLANAIDLIQKDSQILQINNEQSHHMPLLSTTNQQHQQRNQLKEYYYNFSQVINYILKLMMDSIDDIGNPLSRTILLNLCNKFYFKHQTTLVQKWPFYSVHKNITDQLIIRGCEQNDNRNHERDYFNDHNIEDDPFKLQRINALDTYCTLAIVNQKIFTKQLLTTLINIVQIDQNFINQQKTTGLQSSKSKNINQSYHMNQQLNMSRNRKKYNLRKSHSMGLTVDRLIEYKKILVIILLTFTQDNWHNPNHNPQTNTLFLQLLNFSAIEFSLERLLPVRRIEHRLKGLIVFQAQQEWQEQRINEMQKRRQEMIRQTENLRYNSKSKTLQQQQSLIKTSKKYHQTLSSKGTKQKPYGEEQRFRERNYYSTSKQSSLSLFQFIGFIHHNELIYNWLLAIKTGLKQSSIMQEFGGLTIEMQVYNQIWLNIMNKIDKLYHYYANYVQLFLQNHTLTKNLTKLYNYIAQQSAYMVEYQGLTLYFDPLQEDYVRTQLIRSIIEYCLMVMQSVRKCRDVEWKCKQNWSKERLSSLNKCLQLIQKNKVIIEFRQLGIWTRQYNDLKQILNEEIQIERNINRDY